MKYMIIFFITYFWSLLSVATVSKNVAKVMSLQNIGISENNDISNIVIVKSIKVLTIQDKTLCILVILSPLFFQSLQLRIY